MIDISVSLSAGMVTWPGDPPVSIERFSSIDRGDPANVSSVSMSLHTGTHIDAPLHYLPDGASIDRMPLDATVGRARVLHIGTGKEIGPGHLSLYKIRRGERILLKAGTSLSQAGAEFLVERGIRTVGIDSLSIGNDDTHRKLLAAGIWIIEGLELTRVKPGTYYLICLPLKITGADGAPARAMIRPAR
jgi:arylformamidase